MILKEFGCKNNGFFGPLSSFSSGFQKPFRPTVAIKTSLDYSVSLHLSGIVVSPSRIPTSARFFSTISIFVLVFPMGFFHQVSILGPFSLYYWMPIRDQSIMFFFIVVLLLFQTLYRAVVDPYYFTISYYWVISFLLGPYIISLVFFFPRFFLSFSFGPYLKH